MPEQDVSEHSAENDVPEVKAYTVWQWDCPNPRCGDVNERGDADPDGTDECDVCGQQVTVALP